MPVRDKLYQEVRLIVDRSRLTLHFDSDILGGKMEQQCVDMLATQITDYLMKRFVEPALKGNVSNTEEKK